MLLFMDTQIGELGNENSGSDWSMEGITTVKTIGDVLSAIGSRKIQEVFVWSIAKRCFAFGYYCTILYIIFALGNL